MTLLLALIVGVVAAAAVTAAAELAARVYLRARRDYFVFPPGQRLRLHLDRATFPELEPIVRFDVNRDGERGPELPPIDRGESLYRVLVAGGSQPEGYMLDQETFWPGALHRLLNAPERLRAIGASRAHAGSIARSGVGSEALGLLLERVLPRYPRLSAIVILVGASDMLRWLEEGAPRTPSSLPAIGEIFRCHPEGPFGWRPATSALVELLARTHRRVLRPVQESHRVGAWVGRARAMRAAAKVVRTTMPDAGAMLDHFDLHFRRVLQRAKANSERVIVVRQSWFDKETLTQDEAAHMWHGGAGQAWRDNVATYYSIDVTSKLMALLDARAERAASELGVDQIDLRAILEPSLSIYYDYFHLTPAGARRVALAVADALVRQPGVEAPGDRLLPRCVA
jgi:lysophospholipase L1-like esterase